MTPSPEVLYFGCIRETGHYLHSAAKWDLPYNSTPWKGSLDCALLAKDDGKQEQGRARYAVLGGWTMIQFWDRSVDSRFGSNSAFLVHEIMAPDVLLELARQQWPQVFTRPKFPHVVICDSA